ncbi:MAG: GspH/FimT family pseudopilin [Myxococcota bacterium]
MSARGEGLPAPACEAGFTVVELVLVIAIIALLAAVGTPRFLVLGSMQADLYQSEVLAGLRYAQRLAVASGCGVQVQLTASSYTLTQQTGCAGAAWTQAVVDPSTNASSYARSAPAGVALASTVNPLRFDPLGRATNAAGTVSSATVSVGARTISVVGESGYAQAG